MKRNLFFKNLIALLLTLCVVCAVGAASVFAAPEDAAEQQEAVVEETPQENQPEEQQNQPEEQIQPEEQPQEQQEFQQEQEQQNNQWYDYIYSYEEATSAYEEPQYLGELPEAAPEQVVEATAVAMPTVAVSDASLFSGIVMWLCVALGVAVIVGVLVSKRTRRRGV